MLENKDYCDYETSRELKELGFVAGLGEDDCGHCLYDEAWHDQVDRPLLYEAQKWLREEKHIEVLVLSKGMVGAPYDVQVYTEDYSISDDKEYSSYEEALSEGIKEAVKILKDEQTN